MKERRQKVPHRTLTELDMNSLVGCKQLDKQLQRGRTTGKYTLGTSSLSVVPDELYNFEQLADVNFWEEVPTTAIDLSHNQLQSLPNGMASLAALQALDVSDNKLIGLPADLSFPRLEILDISANSISSLENVMISLTSLKRLSCGKNQLTKMSLRCLTGLLELDAKNCRLDKAPDSLEACRNLKRLDLSLNRIGGFPVFQGLSNLTVLNLRQNHLEGSVPPALSSLSALQSLDLSKNCLASLPEAIGELTGLRELLVGSNSLQQLPASLWNLSGLSVLDFQDNRVSEIPSSVSMMHVTHLDMRHNNLASLPVELGLVTSLRILMILGNPLRGIRATLLNASSPVLLAFLRSKVIKEEDQVDRLSQDDFTISNGFVSLANCRLDSIPAAVWQMGDQLLRLDISNCGLQDFPRSRLSALTRLHILNLASNQLREFSLEGGEPSPSLRALDVSHNPLQNIPNTALQSCASSLTSLRMSGIPTLVASRCHFLDGMTSLQELVISQCRLSEVPATVIQLQTLTRLDISSNSISEVPQEMTRLVILAELDLSNNSISKLPPELGLMHPKLRLLALSGNPLRTIRQPLIQKGTPALLEYLRGRISIQS